MGCFMLFACTNNKTTDSTTPASSDSSMASSNKPVPQSEIADAKYADIGRKNLAQFSSGDVDGWLSSYADNARFNWSSGDSIVGKEAIIKYWKDRRANVIDSISISNDIWLPLKVNKPQKGPDLAGIWLLGWYQAHVKYKSGKVLNFWVHIDSHFNSNDKIDLSVEYIDRAPINKAVGK